MTQGTRYKKTLILVCAAMLVFAPVLMTSKLMARDIQGHNNEDNGFTERSSPHEIDPEPEMGKYNSPKACSVQKAGQIGQTCQKSDS